MHLLATERGIISDGSAAVDLGQNPGDIVVLASADTAISLLAAAQARRRADDPSAPSVRLAPVMRLGHNLSVAMYMELVAQAQLVIARVLGGSAYWPYGVERLVETCREHGIPLALLPGDDKPDPELARLSSLPREASQRLWRYLAEGGPGNAENFMRYAANLVGRQTEWAKPAPLLRAGLYWPGRALPSLDEIAAEWRDQTGVVPLGFYPGLGQSGDIAPGHAPGKALTAHRLRPPPATAGGGAGMVRPNSLTGAGRIGNGVGLATPASVINGLRAFREAGYRVGDPPQDGADLMDRLLAGPTNARRHAPAEETLPFNEYSAFFALLPASAQPRVSAHWGAAERDPFFRPGRLTCGDFAIPGFRTGNIAGLVQPARGYNLDPKSTYHDPALGPRPSY